MNEQNKEIKNTIINDWKLFLKTKGFIFYKNQFFFKSIDEFNFGYYITIDYLTKTFKLSMLIKYNDKILFLKPVPKVAKFNIYFKNKEHFYNEIDKNILLNNFLFSKKNDINNFIKKHYKEIFVNKTTFKKIGSTYNN